MGVESVAFGWGFSEVIQWNKPLANLALGTVQFGLPYGIANQTGQVSRSEARAMLQLAADSGIDMLDTAIAYGESETCLGEVGIQAFKVVTKLPAIPDGCNDVSDWVRGQVADSLGRLGVHQLYALLLHRPEQLLGFCGKTLYQAMQKLKADGLVKKLGVSIYDPRELELIVPRFHLDLVQAPFNLVDRRLYTTGWLDRLEDQDIEIHVRSVFLQGLLLMPPAAIPGKFAMWSDLWDRWHQWLSKHSVSATQACLAFPLSFPRIDRIIVGAESKSQLEQIIIAANSALLEHLPDLQCDADALINPSRWSEL